MARKQGFLSDLQLNDQSFRLLGRRGWGKCWFYYLFAREGCKLKSHINC